MKENQRAIKSNEGEMKGNGGDMKRKRRGHEWDLHRKLMEMKRT